MTQFAIPAGLFEMPFALVFPEGHPLEQPEQVAGGEHRALHLGDRDLAQVARIGKEAPAIVQRPRDILFSLKLVDGHAKGYAGFPSAQLLTYAPARRRG